MLTWRRRSSHPGFTLIEMMLVLIIVGAVISAAATVVPSMLQTAKLKDARAVSEKMDLTLEGYFATNGRLPCPDTDATFDPASAATGVENRNDNGTADLYTDDTCVRYEGWLPYKTLGLNTGTDAWGMPYRYGVHQELIKTSPQTVCGNGIFSATPTNGYLYVQRDDNSIINYAYLIVSGNSLIHGKTHAISGGRFDGLNDDQDLRFEAPERNVAIVEGNPGTSYNDLMRGVGLTNLKGEQCSGSLTSTGGGGGQAAYENTSALCQDTLDNDNDDKIDCNDQDCFNIDPCTTPTDTTITSAQLTPNAKAGAYYSSNTPSAAGGSNTYYWSLVSESLGSSSLTIGNINTGSVAGTVNECPGDYIVTLKATDRVTPYTHDQKGLKLTVEYDSANALIVSPSGGTLDPAGSPNITFNNGESTKEQWFELTGHTVGDITWSLQFTGADPTGFTLTKDPTNPKRAKLWMSGHPVQSSQPYPFIVKATHGSSCSTPQADESDQYTMLINADFSVPAYEVGMNGYWKMDECAWVGTNNEVLDAQGEGHHGKGVLVSGGTQSTTTAIGRVCRAGIFRGATAKNYVYIPDSPTLQLGSSFTLSAWVKVFANATDWVRMVGKGNSSLRNYGMWLATNGTVLFQIYPASGTGANAQTSTAINDGGWHHIVMTYDSSLANSNMKVYIDNVQRATTNTTLSPAVSSAPLTFGYAGTDAAGAGFHTYFNGMIDEVRIWNRALPTSEITDLYNNTTRTCSGSCYTGPLAHYRLENNANDELGGYHGTLNGVTFDTTTPKEGCATASFTGTAPSIPVTGVAALDDTGLASFSYWMYWNGVASQMPLNVGSNSSNDMWLNSSAFGFNTFSSEIWGVPFTAANYQNKWVHVVGVFANSDPTLYQMFIDGQPKTLSYRLGSSRASRAIGTQFTIASPAPGNTTYPFKGKLDDMRVYNRGLAANEVLDIYQSTLATCSTTVGIDTTTVPATTMGDATHTVNYSTILTASGGSTPYSWEATAMPAGWSAAGWQLSTNLNNEGVLFGPVTACPGTYTITAKVTDATNGTDTKDLTLTINKGSINYYPTTAQTILCTTTDGCPYTFTTDAPRQGAFNWGSILWQGASANFSMSKTGDATAKLVEGGSSNNSTYFFRTSVTDAACPTNTFTLPESGTYTVVVQKP